MRRRRSLHFRSKMKPDEFTPFTPLRIKNAQSASPRSK